MLTRVPREAALMFAALVWGALIWFIGTGVAYHRRVRLFDEALRRGEPRRARAVARIARSRARWFDRASLTLLHAAALYWYGEFEKALSTLRELRSDRDFGRVGGLACSLEIKCLIANGDHAEAHKRLRAERARLEAAPALGRITSDGDALDAILRCEEEGDRHALDALPTSAGDFDRVVHFHRARAAEQRGESERANAELLAAASGGGELFIARLARERLRLRGGPEPVPQDARSDARRPTVLSHIAQGLRLAALRRSAFASSTIAVDHVLVLALLNVALVVLLRFVDFAPRAWFFSVGAFALAAPVLFFVLASHLATRPLVGRQVLRRRKHPTLHLAGAFYAAMPALLVVHFALMRASDSRRWRTIVAVVVAAWSLAIAARVLRQVAGRPSIVRIAAGCAIVAGGWLLPMHAVAETRLWFGVPDRGAKSSADAASYFLEQADRLHAVEGALLPERPGVEDLFFLGVAAHGGEDVFSSEVRAARALFDRRFDTAGRSLVLVNDPVDRSVPAASSASIRHALRAIAARMNRDEDVLFMFVTSHGSDEGLAIRPSHRIADAEVLAPTQLRELLDASGIRWRVLVVAGCHSGVFMDALKTDATLVVTAAASDRASYGCAPGRPMTEFGRAVFGEQLAEQQSFAAALAKAIAVVAEREASHKLTPSAPLLHVGKDIAAKLERLEHRIFSPAAAEQP